MLQRQFRLSKERDIRRVLRFGRTLHAAMLTLRFLHHEGGKRIAVVVSKKVSKKATERNTIKRRLHGVLEHAMTTLQGEADYLVIVRPQAAGLTGQQLCDDLQSLLKAVPKKTRKRAYS